VQKTPTTIMALPYRIEVRSLAPNGTLEANMMFEVSQGDTGLTLVYQPFERDSGTITVTL
jgi:hypothetical protein